MKRQHARITRVGVLSILLVVAVAIGVVASELPMRLQARAGVTGGAAAGRTSMIDITIRAWTSDETRKGLLMALEEGPTQLQNALQEQESVGRIQPRGGLGIDLRYARKWDQEGKTVLIVASDRPMNVGEARSAGRQSMNYNVTYAIVELNEKGRGEGHFVVGAELRISEQGQLEVISAGQGATQLTNVRVSN